MSQAEGHQLRSTHPPVHLRKALLQAAPPRPGTERPAAAEMAAIDTELACAEPEFAKETLRDFPL